MPEKLDPEQGKKFERAGRILLAVLIVIAGIFAWWTNYGSPEAQENPKPGIFGSAAN